MAVIRKAAAAEDMRRITTVLVSTWNKEGLEAFAESLVKMNPAVRFYATGGSYKVLKKAVGSSAMPVEKYTGHAEMPGGLVKTLHPKIHTGILAESRNAAHHRYLCKLGAVHFDMVVANLYPFAAMSRKGVEEARSHIDIGGVTMMYAAAKNFLKVAVVTDTADYGKVVAAMKKGNGSMDLETRARLAQKAFRHAREYLGTISSYFGKKTAQDISGAYR